MSGRPSSACSSAEWRSVVRVASEPQSTCALANGSRVPTSIALTLSELEPALMTRTRVIRGAESVRPGPARDLGRVFALRARECRGGQACIDHLLTEARGALAEAGNAVNDVDDEVEAVDVVAHCHIEGRSHRALFLVAADVHVDMIVASVRESMDQPRIAMEGKDDRLVAREQRVELAVRHAVRMLGLLLQPHQVHDVDEAHLQVR